MLWKNATSSGIFVISTRLARYRTDAAADHQAEQHPAHAPAAQPASLTISAMAGDRAAISHADHAEQVAADRRGRDEDRPLSAWMKQTLAIRYSSK